MPINAVCGAQRRPGQNPGNTLQAGRIFQPCLYAQRRPGQNPGNTTRCSHCAIWRITALNEGRGRTPATPRRGHVVGADRQQRSTKAGAEPRQHRITPISIRPRLPSLNEGRGRTPATPRIFNIGYRDSWLRSTKAGAEPRQHLVTAGQWHPTVTCAQRRPGQNPGNTLQVVFGLLEHQARSTKAGAEPRQHPRAHVHVDIGLPPRSTKAGAEPRQHPLNYKEQQVTTPGHPSIASILGIIPDSGTGNVPQPEIGGPNPRSQRVSLAQFAPGTLGDTESLEVRATVRLSKADLARVVANDRVGAWPPPYGPANDK